MTTYDEGIRPADAVDLTVAGLHEVQRDLGEACTWLRANWPAHLPQPVVSRAWFGGGALAALEVQAGQAEALREAADVMGVEVAPDRLPSYVAACRFFGRVELRAWLETDRWDDEVPY